MKSKLEEQLAFQLKACKFQFTREFRFDPNRRWRADFFLPPYILVEVEGGIWMPKGGHTSGVGYENNCEKYNAAVIQGYLLLRFTGKHIRSGEAIDTIKQAIAAI